MAKSLFLQRDISWLSFNGRVLQEANDNTVPIQDRIRFLGIFSNNLDEFFRVRVASLKRMQEISDKKKKANMHLEENPQIILDKIQTIVLNQQNEFARIWEGIVKELKKENIQFVTAQTLNSDQKKFAKKFFEEKVRSNIIPLLIESLPQLPYLRDKSLYLGVVMSKRTNAYQQQYALIEVPAKAVGRFVILPSKNQVKQIMLLEEIIKFNLPDIFTYFDYNQFDAWICKITKDAELDLDDDLSNDFVEKIEKGVKNRRKGKPVRFIYDKEMDAGLLSFLISKLALNRKSNIIPGGKIHNFRHFIDFPEVFPTIIQRTKPFTHPELSDNIRVTNIVLKKDVMLHFPYHSFNSVIDLLREAAMDPEVFSIKLTAYRLAADSKIVNALINAARNGKQVTVMLELKARFDEESNLYWKGILEEEGVKVLLGVPRMKVHAKLCVIRKKVGKKYTEYGFVSTGNLNEKTASIYGDHCLLTANKKVMIDINRIFNYLENWQKGDKPLQLCKTLLVSPISMRPNLVKLINQEIINAKKGLPASLYIKTNSLSDQSLILKLYEAAKAGVEINLIIRGIYCAKFEQKKLHTTVTSISIIDQYLEHGRVLIFHNNGKEKIFISSADWMVRNLDHRVEAAIPIHDPKIGAELKAILQIQLNDNTKARILNGELLNNYVTSKGRKIRSQIETYQYLSKKRKQH